MLAAQAVQLRQHLGRGHLLAVQGDDVAVFVFDVEVFGLVGCRFRRHGPAPHRFLGFRARVFQVAAFERDVQQVGVHRVRRAAVLVLHVDLDAGDFRVLQQLLTRQQVPLAPRGDDLDVRLQRVRAQLEAHLVVALAGRAVRHGVGAGFVGDLDQALGDQRTRDRRAQQVFAFVDGVGAEHREHEVAHEFFAHVVDVDVFRLDAELQRLGARRFQLFTLAQVGGEGDDFALVVILQPFQDDGGIEAARVGEDYFFNVAHGSSSERRGECR